jgi:hypothetical protein
MTASGTSDVSAGRPELPPLRIPTAWVVQRIIQQVLQRRAEASDDPRIVAGYTAGSMIARGWLCAGAIFAVGIAEGDEAGLSAALLVIALFTVYFTVRMILRPIDAAQARRPR